MCTEPYAESSMDDFKRQFAHDNSSKLSSKRGVFGQFQTHVRRCSGFLRGAMTNSSDISSVAQQKAVEKASRAANPFESLSEWMKFPLTDGAISLYCKKKADVDSKTLKWAFKLAERNVGPFYKKCSMGWQPKIKQSDLNKNWARYLVAVDEKKSPVAYAMFRFDIDYGSSVLYCYEMQIDEAWRRKGLGRFMMSGLEKCAAFWSMEKIILTVLNNNIDAMAFFTKLGFTTDDTSPDKSEMADYEILSKKLF